MSNEIIFNHDYILLNFDKLCDDFLTYVKKNFKPYNINDNKKKEIELSFENPPFEVLSILYNYPKSKKQTIVEIKTFINDKKNIRIRKKISNRLLYNQEDLIEVLKNDTLEQKIIEDFENYKYYNFKTSLEEKSFQSLSDIKDKKVFLINSIQLSNEYFIIEFKVKNKLFNRNGNYFNSYFDKKNTNRFLNLEIELNNKLINIDEKIFKEKFLDIIQHGFGINQSSFKFCFEYPKLNLKTYTADIVEIFSLNYKEIYITKKINGLYFQFIINNSQVYIIKNNIVFIYETNVKDNIYAEGIGELIYIDNKRKLYPFFFKSIKINNKKIIFNNRSEMYKIIDKIIVKKQLEQKYKHFIKKDDVLQIEITKKEIIGNFDTKEEYYEALLMLMNKTYVEPTDGIVIFNNKSINIDDIRDYKFKEDNTLDLYTNLNIYNKESVIDMNLHFNLYFMGISKKDNMIKKNFQLIFNPSIILSKNLSIDEDLTMIIYSDNNKIYHIFPINFISEYSIKKNLLIPRFDKTEKFFKSNKKYYGNNLATIIKCIVIEKYNLNISVILFKELLKNNQLEEYLKQCKIKIDIYSKKEQELLSNVSYDDNIIIDRVLIDENKYIKTPLNININWYKPEMNSRMYTNLNNASNLNKTFGLAYGINRFINENHYKNLLSLYCGKGGDMNKFIHNDVSFVLGIDPDKEALNTFNKRYIERNKNGVKVFKLKLLEGCLEETDIINNIYKEIGYNYTFDVIDCQLGLHFSLCSETETHIMNIFKRLSNNIIKTKILISTNDKDNIFKIFEKHQFTKDEIVFKIDSDNTYNIKYIDNEKMAVYYNFSMNNYMEEYLISKSYLINLFIKNGFKLLQTWTFDELFKDQNEIFKYLKTIFERKSTKSFLSFIENIDLENNKDLKTILETYRYYIFERS